jgi:hypothetical protein
MKIIYILLFALLIPFSYAALEDGLVYHYSLEDNAASTVVLDSIGNLNLTTDTNTNGLTTSGKNNNALVLGTSHNMYGRAVMGINGTIDFWYKQNSVPSSFSSIFSYFNHSGAPANLRYEFNTGNNNAFHAYFYPPSGSCESSDLASITLGIWYHITISRSPALTNYITFYINGLNAQDMPCNTYFKDVGDGTFYFNSEYNGNSKSNGVYDEISIWNRTLSAAEVLQLNNTFYPFAAPAPTPAPSANASLVGGTTSVSIDMSAIFILVLILLLFVFIWISYTLANAAFYYLTAIYCFGAGFGIFAFMSEPFLKTFLLGIFIALGILIIAYTIFVKKH